MRKLSPELITLVHHIKLHESGWWDKALQRLVITVVWIASGRLTVEEILNELGKNFDINIELKRLEEQLSVLVTSGDFVVGNDRRYSISEIRKRSFEDELQKYEDLEQYAKEKFSEAVVKYDKTLNVNDIWETFHEKFLFPLIDEMGAKFFELISNAMGINDSNRLVDFTKLYSEDMRFAIRSAVIDFINPSDPQIKSYILRQLNASFYVKAGNLKDEDIKKLLYIKDKKLTFSLFVDTNLLFSILNLHENPANDVAHELLGVIKKIKNFINVNLFISPATIEEAKQVIGYHKNQLKYFRCSKNLVKAALRQSDLDGFTIKYFERCAKSKVAIDPDEYFDPYIGNFITTIRPSGLELYNDKSFETYSTRQDVIDDILMETEYEKKRYPDDPKKYEQLRHDIVLWHFIKDLRPAYVESPVECQYWIITADFRFIGYDFYKRRGTSLIPVCVYPTTLIQILQLWVPRSEEFEDAIIRSFRIPFLMEEFSVNSEKTTIGILKVLSRYENIDDLDENTIASILINDTLRKKFDRASTAEQQGDLVREAILVEYKAMREKVSSAESQSIVLKSEIGEKTNEIDMLRKQLAAQEVQTESKTKELSEKINNLIGERNDLKARLDSLQTDVKQLHDSKESDKLIKYHLKKSVKYFIIIPSFFLVTSLVFSAALCYLIRYKNLLLYTIIMFLIFINIYIFVLDYIAQKNSKIKSWGVFVILHKFKLWIITAIGAITITLITELIKKYLHVI